MQEGTAILDEHKIPNYPHPERAALALKAMSMYRRFCEQPQPEYETFAVDQARVRKIIDETLSEQRLSIGDPETRDILSAYGFDIPDSELAETPDQAVEIADRIGYPVVLKVASPDILHKTDVGGVRVGLQSTEDVRDAFDLITYRCQRYLPEARLWGCLVQKMVPPGLEVLIGMNRDPQFGPLVTFGLGGIYVEILKDVAFRLAPFSRLEAKAMLGEIRAHALLDGFRNQRPVDKEAIIDSLLRVGQMVIDFPQIAELDINPFVVYEQERGGVALDMRLVLTPDGQTHAEVAPPGSAGSVP